MFGNIFTKKNKINKNILLNSLVIWIMFPNHNFSGQKEKKKKDCYSAIYVTTLQSHPDPTLPLADSGLPRWWQVEGGGICPLPPGAGRGWIRLRANFSTAADIGKC